MRFKKTFLTLLISLLITSLFTCNVFANSSTYIVYSNSDEYSYLYRTAGYSYDIYISDSNNDVRALYFSKTTLCFVSLGSFKINYKMTDLSNNQVSIFSYTASLHNSDGNSYYSQGFSGGSVIDTVLPTVPTPSDYYDNYKYYYYYYYYTFGEGAVAPVPPRPDYGSLNISYSTKIAGQGQASLQNKDVLDWSVLSSNGYDLSSGAIELRLVPGSYTASSQSNLMSLIYTDFVIDLANAYYLDSVPLNQLSYEMTWENIIGHLNDSTPAYSWLSIQATDGQWLKNGWIWQYRIMIDGEYLTDDYLTIYTSTSSGVSNAENIVNNNYNITLQNTINNINYINNDNSQWYYQDIAIPDYDSSNDSSSWLSTLIEVIGNLLNKLLDLIGGAFSAITDGIVNLINGLGVDILGVFTNLFNNIFNFLGNLDFTSSEWLLPQSYNDNIEGFTGATNGILSVWFDNGLGLFILIPMLVWLLGVVL